MAVSFSREPFVVSVNQACELMCLSRSKIYGLMNRGDLTWVQIDGRRRIHLSSVRDLLEIERMAYEQVREEFLASNG